MEKRGDLQGPVRGTNRGGLGNSITGHQLQAENHPKPFPLSSHCCEEILDQRTLRKSLFGSESIIVAEMQGSWSLVDSQEAERGEGCCSACSLLFIHPRTSPHGMVLHIIRVGLPASAQPRNSLTDMPMC